MPLQFQNVEVPIAGGLEQKSDQRLLPPGKVTSVANGVFTRLQGVEKRPGNVLLPSSSLLVSGSRQLLDYKDQLLSIDYDGTALVSYSPTAAAWTAPNYLPGFTATRRSIAEATTSFANPDVAYCNGYVVCTWIGNGTNVGSIIQGDIYYSVTDQATGATVVPATCLTSASPQGNWNPKALAVGNNVCIFYVGNTLALNMVVVQCVPGVRPSIIETELGVVSGGGGTSRLNALGWYDVCTDDASVWVVYADGSATPKLVVCTFGIPLISIQQASFSESPDSFGVATCCILGSLLVIAYSYQDSTHTNDHTVVFVLYKDTLNIYAYPTDIFATGGTDLGVGQSFALGVVPLSTASVAVAWQDAHYDPNTNLPTPRSNSQVVHLASSSLGGITTVGPRRFCLNTALLSKPFTAGTFTQRGYVLAALDSSTQGTLLAMDMRTDDTATPNLVWRPACVVAPRLTISNGVFNNLGMLPFVATAASSSFYGVTTILESSENQGRNALQLVQFTPGSMLQTQGAEAGDNLNITAGVPSYYDGQNTGEVGFIQYPEGLTATVSGSGGGIQGPGNYQYSIVYEWIDAEGQRHQSFPMVPITATAQNSTSGSITLLVPCCTVTNRQSTVSGSNAVSCVVYRSTLNGTILYRLTPENSPPELLSTPLSPTVKYVDKLSDGQAGLSSQATLYTEGGVFGYFNPPTSKYCCVHDQRVWLAGMDDPKVVWYSNELVQGQPATFNDLFSFTVDDGGDITAIAPMDTELVVFKDDRIFFVQGSGPNALGQGSSLTNPIRVPSDVGCTSARSVVAVPDGLMFRSKVGLHMLTRSNTVQNVGHPIYDLLNQYPIVTSAVRHPTRPEVRFTLAASSSVDSPGAVAVFDYLSEAWTTLTYPSGLAAWAAMDHRGTYTWTTSGSAGTQVFTENTDEGNATDNGGYVGMTVESPWVAVGDVGGYARVKRVTVAGTVNDSCNVSVSLATDYSPTYNQVATFPSYLLPAPGQLFQVNVHVGQQKCTAMRVKVQDSYPTVLSGSVPVSGSISSGRGIMLDRVVLTAAPKQGTLKLPPSQRA